MKASQASLPHIIDRIMIPPGLDLVLLSLVKIRVESRRVIELHAAALLVRTEFLNDSTYPHTASMHHVYTFGMGLASFC